MIKIGYLTKVYDWLLELFFLFNTSFVDYKYI